jgi:hypothetical protein
MGILDAIGYTDAADDVDLSAPLPLTPEQASQSYKAAADFDVTPDEVTQGMRDEHRKKMMFEGAGDAFKTKMANPTFRAAVQGDEKSPSAFEEIALSIAPADKSSGDWSDIARRGFARSVMGVSRSVMGSDAVDLREQLDELRKPKNYKEWERRHGVIEERLRDLAARIVRERAVTEALRPSDAPMTKIGQAWNEKGALAAVGEFLSHPIDSTTDLFSEASLPLGASMGAGVVAAGAAGVAASVPAGAALAIAALAAGAVDASISAHDALFDQMEKAGVDMKDVDSVADFLIRDARFNRTWGKAQNYGTAVGAGTAVSLGLSRITTPVRLGAKATEVVPPVAKAYEAINANAYRHMLQNFGAQVGIQGSVGAGAEAVGQIAADGKVTDTFSVFLNGVTDMVTAPIELGVSSFAVRQGVRAQKARTEFNAMQLQKAVQVAKNSQAFEKTPELFDEFATAVGEQNPGIATVGIDVASLHQDGEAGAAAVEAIKEILPHKANEIDEAVKTGSVVELPLAQYIQAAKDDRVTASVSRHSVVGDDASLAQAQRAEAAVVQDRGYGIARFSKGRAPEFRVSLQKVAREYKAALDALPGMQKKGGDEKERLALVALTMNHVANMAADAGMLPEEVWRDFGIRHVLSGGNDIVRADGGLIAATNRAKAAFNDKVEGDLGQIPTADEARGRAVARVPREGLQRKPDEIKVEVIDIGNPQLRSPSELREAIITALAGTVVKIKSTGQDILLSKSGLKRSAKKRSDEHSKLYSSLLRVIERSEYDGTEPNDGLKGHTVDQDVYHSAVRMGGKLYSVRIKADVASAGEKALQASGAQEVKFDGRYADHAVAEIDVSEVKNYPGQLPSEGLFPVGVDRGTALPASTSGVSAITLGVIRGNVKPSKLENNLLSQETLGAYYPDHRTIVRWQGANRSTLLHETGHWYLFSRAKLAQELRARTDLTDAQKEFILWTEKTIQWLGGKDIESFLNMPIEDARAMHEKFARTYEQYLKDGRAPNSALTRVFRLFSGWLKNVVYGILKAVPGSAEMKPDVQELFDALFVSSEQIREAQLRRHLFLAMDKVKSGDVAQSEVDDALVRAMNAAFKNVDDAAEEKFNRRGEAVVGRLRRLRDRVFNDLTKQAEALRKQYTAEAINERLGERRLDAEIFFDTAQTRYDKRGGERKVKPKLLASDLAKMGIDEWRIEELKKRGWVSQRDDVGVLHHPELVAETLGFSSASEMVFSLTTDVFDGKTREKWAEPIVQERMQNEHPELAEKETIAESADAAVFNLTASQMVALEIQFLEGARGKPVELALFDAVANASLSEKTISDVKPKTMRTAATRFAEQAQDMVKKGNLLDAATAKRRQLAQMRMADLAQDFLDRAESFVKKMQKAYAPGKSEAKGMPIEYFEQVQRVLYTLGLNRSAPAYDGIPDYATFFEAEKNYAALPERPAFVGTKPFADMTVAQAREAMQFVEDLIQAGKSYYKMQVESIRLNAKQLDDAVAGEIVDGSVARGVKTKRLNDDDHTPWMKRQIEGLTGFVYGHIRFQTLWSIFTGKRDNAFSRALGAAIDAARDSENDMQFKAATKFDAAMRELESAITDDKVTFYPELGGSFDKRQIVAMALNIGNEENFQRLLDGSTKYNDFRNESDLNRPWAKEDVLSAIGKALSRKELEAVQKVWDVCGQFGRDLQALEADTRNRRMLLVKPSAVTISLADGGTVTLKGGYYPIEYDGRRSAFDRKEEVGGGVQPTRKSTAHTINRAASGGGRPVTLSMGAGYRALNEAIHDIAWRRVLMDVEKLLRANTATSNAILKYHGREAYDEAKGWVKDMWDNGRSLKVDGFQTFMRKNASIAGLGLNFVTALLQPLGYTQSIAMVGGRWCAGAMATYLHNPRKASRFVMGKSKLMQSRMRTRFKELREVQALYDGGGKKLKDMLIRKCFAPIAFSQVYTVDVPTWMAAYEKALAEGKLDGEAVSIADRALVESQGGGDLSDLARQERSRNVFNVFYGFFGTMLNATAITANTTKGAERAMKLALILVVQPVLESFLRAGLDQTTSDDNEDYGERVLSRIPKDLGSFYLGSLMGVREFVPMLDALSGSAQGYSGPTGMRMVNDAVRFTLQVQQGDFDRALRRASVNFILGDLAGLPSTEINRLWDAGEAMADDEWADAVLYAIAGKKGK